MKQPTYLLSKMLYTNNNLLLKVSTRVKKVATNKSSNILCRPKVIPKYYLVLACCALMAEKPICVPCKRWATDGVDVVISS